MRCPFAVWKGAASVDYSTTKIDPTLVVWHVAQGSSSSGLISWFHNPDAQVSAHFSIGEDGQLFQFVDTHEEAFAEMAFNGRAISIETLGYSGTPLTKYQEETATRLIEWIHTAHKIPYMWRLSPYKGPGHVSHGELGVAGGDHLSCPGVPRVENVKNLLLSISRVERRRFLTIKR